MLLKNNAPKRKEKTLKEYGMYRHGEARETSKREDVVFILFVE
jgi:hypothetical protein